MKKTYCAPMFIIRRFDKEVLLESAAFAFDGEDFYKSDFFGN